jgi:hypothetical protein
MPNNSSTLNWCSYLKYLFKFIYCSLGFTSWNDIASVRPNLAGMLNFVAARSIFVFFTPAFLNREPRYGAF